MSVLEGILFHLLRISVPLSRLKAQSPKRGCLLKES